MNLHIKNENIEGKLGKRDCIGCRVGFNLAEGMTHVCLDEISLENPKLNVTKLK